MSDVLDLLDLLIELPELILEIWNRLPKKVRRFIKTTFWFLVIVTVLVVSVHFLGWEGIA